MEEAELCFPGLLNSSCMKRVRPDAETRLIYSLVSSVALLTVVLNLLVIISISHFRQLHTPTNLLLLSLALSDFLVGLFVMPFQILLTEPCWLLGDLACVFSYFVSFTNVYASVVNMVLISADRYVAVCDPMSYSTRVTHKRVKLWVVLCWLYCAFYSFMILSENFYHPGKFNSCYGECVINILGAIDVTFGFVLPISAIIILYVRVFVVAVSQARSIRSHVAAVRLPRSGTVSVKKSELKAARTLGVIVVVFLMCYCPFFCVSLSGSDLQIGSSINTFMDFIVYFNSCLNPVIYALFYPWFRKSVKFILTLKILWPESYMAKIL